jgi:hypothetical protein
MSRSSFSPDEVLRTAADHARPEDRHRLHAVLRAAAAPARPGELDGEETAVAAFRSAASVRPASLKVRVAKLLTVKAVAVATAVLSVGGVAVAATTGALPGPLNLSNGPASADQPAPNRLAPSARPGRPASSPAALVARCHDFLGRNPADRRHALESGDFRELIAGAGAKERVEDYCGQLIRTGVNPPAVSGSAPSLPSAGARPGRTGGPGRSPDPDHNGHQGPPPGAGNTPTPDGDGPSAEPTPTPSSDGDNAQVPPPTEAD